MTTPPAPEDLPPEERTMAWRPPASGAGPGAGSVPPPSPSGLPHIDGITLGAEIARGGMGVVYSGRQDFLDRRVAVKFLAKELRSEQFTARFRREAKILAGIKHQNIVACHAAGTTDEGQSYLVMEFVDGPNLKTWIAQNGPLAVPAALRLLRALASALGHAHELGVIHRDVKPENILLESATSTQLDFAFPFTPKLVDLGLARMTHEGQDLGLTSPGSVMGTPATMAPEQFDDPDGVDFRADIYGLGCVLYEMLTGQAPFRAARLGDLVVQKRQPIGPDPCQVAAWIPAEVGALVSSLLAADRDARPGSYDELAQRLQGLLDSQASTGVPPPGASGAPSWPNPNPNPTPLPSSSTPARGSRPPLPPPAPTQVPPSPAKAPPAPSGVGGLLRTSEFEFLAAGGPVSSSDTSAPQFRETRDLLSTPVPTDAAATAPPVASPATTVPPPAAAAPRRSPMPLVVGGLLLLGGAVVAWLQLRGGEQPAVVPETPPVAAKPDEAKVVPPPPPVRAANAEPAAPTVGGPESLQLNVAGSFVATATDPDGDPLTYRWSSPQTRFVTFAPPDAAATEVRLLDGLPTESFTIECAVADGQHPAVVARKVIKVEAYKPRNLLPGFKADDSPWTIDDPVGWVQNLEDGSVSCTATGEPRVASCQLGTDAYWQLVGRFEAARFNGPEFADTQVRLTVGDAAYAVRCTRSDSQGVQWHVELQAGTAGAGGWRTAPLAPPLLVEFRDEADEGHAAFVSIKRRLDEIVFQIGCAEQRLLTSYTVTVPPGAPEPRLELWATAGRGVFRELKLF